MCRAKVRAKLAPSTAIEVWCQDEMLVGLQMVLRFRWPMPASFKRPANEGWRDLYPDVVDCPELVSEICTGR
jgi:hypothetical protein